MEENRAPRGMNYQMVRNGQDRCWGGPQERPLPPGWWPAGFAGAKVHGLSFVDDHWTDLWPRDLRTWWAEA